MKEFLTKNKWLGFVALLLYTAFLGVYAANKVIPAIKEYMPVFAEQADQFLPVTIENGEIVDPKDTVISKTYGSDKNAFKVVLDTRVDEFESSALQDPGFYVSRKYVYGVTEQKTEVRSFEGMKVPNMVIDNEVVKTGLDYVENNVGKYLFGGVFIGMLIFSSLAILLYTIVMHWVIAIWFKVPFSQTLCINCLSYIVISFLKFFGSLHIGIIITLVALIAANVGINSMVEEPKE